ncbi:MAG: heme lyase CcmF/NrfE family subunit [Longimicrobiales bacterium]
MTRALGYSATAVALALAIYGAIAVVAGVRAGRRDLVESAKLVTYTNFALLSLANAAMVYALVARDFSIDYVAQVGSRATPMLFTVISLWSALEGSILFWGLVLAGYSAAAVWLYRRERSDLFAYAAAALLIVQAFFLLLLVGPANPFGRVWPVPADGPGPNPLLQNHILMAIHPPFLYLGYVGMTVPFAFAIGALLSGRLDDRWIRVTRRWTVTAWGFLSVAIMFGMWWSYEVLGWGGYWAWDPVENASFMPWLTATAFLHSSMVQERREMLKVWNLTLIVATFLLTILGTFLTRSGVLSSVHAFTQGTIGMYFLAFIALTLVGSLVLLAGRSDRLRTTGSLDSPASREAVFLVNNLLLVAFTFTVLLGTLFPLAADAVRGVKVSVGAPFFNRMTLPLIMALLFLVGVGPALPWRRAAPGSLRHRFVAPAAAFAVAVSISIIVGTPSIYAVLAFGFAAFALVSNLEEFRAAAAARRRAQREAWPIALTRAVAANRRRYGGYVAHIGVLIMAVGIAASSAFRVEREQTLAVGEAMQVEGYTLRFDRLFARDEPQRFVVGASLSTLEDGRTTGELSPRMNFYPTSDQPIATPAIRSGAVEDLYTTLMAFERDGSSATIRVVIEPLVAWIWVGGFIIALGALIAALPGSGRRRTAAVRTPRAVSPSALETVGAGDPT